MKFIFVAKNAYKEAMFVQRFKLDCICAFFIILFDVKRNIDDIIKYTVKKDIKAEVVGMNKSFTLKKFDFAHSICLLPYK